MFVLLIKAVGTLMLAKGGVTDGRLRDASQLTATLALVTIRLRPEQQSYYRERGRRYVQHRDRAIECLRAGDLLSARNHALAGHEFDTGGCGEMETIRALVSIAQGDHREAVSLVAGSDFNPSAPLDSLILVRSQLALGQIEPVWRYWNDFSGNSECWSLECERGLPPVTTEAGLRTRVLLAFGVHVVDYPVLALASYMEAGRTAPKSPFAALGVVRALRKTGRFSETLPFWAIAKVYGNDLQRQIPTEALTNFPEREQDAALRQASSRPATAYRSR